MFANMLHMRIGIDSKLKRRRRKNIKNGNRMSEVVRTLKAAVIFGMQQQ
jgi:hypothetical protein